jgi:Ras-related protein Rab-2A
MSNYDYMFKCIVIGDVAVGKTSINNHFVEGRFDPEHHATLGVEYSAKTLQVAGLDVKMQIWDTSGQ